MARTLSARGASGATSSCCYLVAALFGGWSLFWNYAADKAEATIEGWRAREAKAGRIYACGEQTIGGYPFRFELNCERASALFNSNQPPIEIKSSGVLVAAQVYQPTLLISEFHGPLTIANPGQPPDIIVNWKLAQSSLRGTPAAPERVALVFDRPVVDRMTGGSQQHVLTAQHIEIHGRIAGGSVASNPVIEVALKLDQAAAPGLLPATARAGRCRHHRGPARLEGFRAQALGGAVPRDPGGRTAASKSGRRGCSRAKPSPSAAARCRSMPTGGSKASCASRSSASRRFSTPSARSRWCRRRPRMDKLSGMLDRLAPGLGNVARQQVGANISAGINMLGEQTTLEGKPAVTLPLRFSDGAVFLGPIPIGKAPALF